jgi:protein-L-isoaspartate(D-aspartate) O-methyltransferase
MIANGNLILVSLKAGPELAKGHHTGRERRRHGQNVACLLFENSALRVVTAPFFKKLLAARFNGTGERGCVSFNARGKEKNGAFHSAGAGTACQRIEIFRARSKGDVRMKGNGHTLTSTGAEFEATRRDMVARQIRERGIRSPHVLDAMEAVPRHLFVPLEHIQQAYADEPLPIGEGQTISQPFMVAAMAEALALEGHERVLEVGAGSGYQAAVLSLLANSVIAVEAQGRLAASARELLARLGFANVRVEEGDGSLGWPAGAPYEAILVTAAAPAVPPPLVDQLAEGGRIVIPVGGAQDQDLLRIVKRDGRITRQTLYACRFVPLLGRYGWSRESREPNRS